MKPHAKWYLQTVAGLLLVLAAPGNPAALLFRDSKTSDDATENYTYEEKNVQEEKKRYIVKIEKDKRKCELAIINTKTLIGRSKNRPYLPELYLRLAELYIEKSRLAFFLRKSEQENGGERALDQYESTMLKKQALEIYQRILENHPDVQYLDKVHFFMAHEYYELGQTDDMLTHYKTITDRYPDSRYAPEAQLLLGDYFFNQKQDVEQSIAHYTSVLNYPRSPAVAAARYKLAWCRINQNDFPGALKLFEESVTSPQAAEELDIDTYRRVDVRLESLVDMAYCYPEVHKDAPADSALAYFKEFAWSRPVYTTVLEKLAYRYYVKKKWDQAAPIYRRLALIRQDPEKLLEYARHIFESVQALGTYQHAEKDVAIIVRALEKHVYSPHMVHADKQKLINDYEIYGRDIITHLHAKARQTNSHQDFMVAAEAYKQYLDFFTDSPAAAEMAANYAEALFSAGSYLEAGKQYEKVAPPATANSKQRGEALYSAVISYYQALKEKDTLNFYQAAYAREGLRSVGKTFAGEFPDSQHTPEVLFNVAWVSYDAGDYQLAVDDLSNFVNSYPRHPAATAAVHLVMDAFHIMEDFEGMIRYGKSILAAGMVGDAKLRQEVAHIVRGAESRVVSGMTMAAMDDWENTRRELIQVVDKNAGEAMGEQALNALIVSSSDKNDLPTLFEAGDTLIKRYPGSPHVENTLGVLINTSISIGQMRLLAEYLESFCRSYPQHKNFPEFNLQAARIREGLGQYAKANQNYQRYLAAGNVAGQQLDDLVFSIVENARRLGNDTAAADLLKHFRNRLTRNGMLRAQARTVTLDFTAGRRSQALKTGQAVLQRYRPQMGEKDPLLRDLVAEIAYNNVHAGSGPYFKLRLKNTIDNSVVEKKAALLASLEEGYQKVLTLKSPTWALKACYQAGEINREFAEFLLTAPVPGDLGAEQLEQYRNLIQQKAHAYRDKAAQYRKSTAELARKWEVCDPELRPYYSTTQGPTGGPDGAANRAGNEIGRQALKEHIIAELYRKLLASPENSQLQYQLARAYLKQGDFRQAGLVAQNAVSKFKGPASLNAGFLNLIGLTHLHSGNDALAKEAFKQALEADAGLVEARVNLASLYRRYDHGGRADELMKAAPLSNLDQDAVYPRTGVNSNEYSLQSN